EGLQERGAGTSMGRLRDGSPAGAEAAGPVRVPGAVSGRRRGAGSRPPALVVAIAVIGLLVFFVAPLAALVQRAPWGSFWSTLTDPDVRTALRLSLQCSLAATALSALFGLPIAWLLARTEFRGKAIVRAFAVLPLVLPPVVGGVA